MTCHNCRTEVFKFGFHKGYQRYCCKQCNKTFTDIPPKPLDNLHVSQDKAVQVIHMLVEGIGIRAIERLSGVSRPTVLAILELAGEKCERFMEARIRNVQAEQIQADELYCFVRVRQQNAEPDATDCGEFFTYLAIDADSKLIITHRTGKRTSENTRAFITNLNERVAPGFQLTTDAFGQYCGETGAVRTIMGSGTNYATETKHFARPAEFFPRQLIGRRCKTVCGNPDPERITINHVERTNLTVRLFTRRFTRCTLGYSKKLANLKHGVALFVCHFNFCRPHSALGGQTPAMAAKLAPHRMSILDLLSA